MSKKILIISGEPSGDLHASNLVKDLKTLDPDLQFFGMGGPLSKASGVDILFDISRLALIGVVEVLRHISVVKNAHDAVISCLDSRKPDAAILVDYPGFNLKIARDLARRNIPVIYYISPQVWAWGRQRVDIIKKYVKKMVVFFKFEEELYKTYGIDAEFVGHPLLDIVRVTLSKDEVFRKYRLSKDKKTIALLPGSRESEIAAFLPVMADAARLITGKIGNVQFIISKHPHRPSSMYGAAFKDKSIDFRFAEGDLHNIVGASDFVIVASGTATLETAIIGTPLIITYKTSLLTYLLYKLVSTTAFIGLVNVIAGKEVAPELLQFNATPEKIADKTVEILTDEKRLSGILKDLGMVKSSLGHPGAGLRAARAILPLLQ